ncbi:MAG: integrase [Candidatus Bathyarchaeia archaeon]
MDGTVLGPSFDLNGGFTVERLIKAYGIAERALKGLPLKADLAIRWGEDVKDRFIKFMESKGRSKEYIRDVISYLDKYVSIISCPEDVIKLFSSCERGRDHLDKALRNLFNFYEVVESYPEDFLNRLRKAIPKIRTGVDYKEIEEPELIETFIKLKNYEFKYYVLYQVTLDSGLRQAHILHMLRAFNPDRLESLRGFSRYTLGLERGTKSGLYVYMRDETAKMVRELAESGNVPCRNTVKSFIHRHVELVKLKYVRKFAYNKMVLSGIPETVADFINGRKPRTIGGRHYMWLREQADQHYPKYIRYLKELTKKIQSYSHAMS